MGLTVSQAMRHLFSIGAVVVDTETTGITGMSEIVSIAVIARDGTTLMDTLVKPFRPIPYAASKIHGITDSMVRNAPTWRDVAQEYELTTRGKVLLAYNCSFDQRMVAQTHLLYGLRNPARDWHCVMKGFTYSIDARKNIKLGEAAAMLKLPIPEGSLHSARTDAVLTLWLALKLAGLDMAG